MKTRLSSTLYFAFLLIDLTALINIPAVGSETFRPLFVSVDEIQDALNSGLTCAQLTQTFINRTSTYNNVTRAAITIDTTNALANAQAVDTRRSTAAGTTFPLDCVPLIVKDNIDTNGLLTTVGSAAMLDNIPTRTASVVQRLLDRGAIIIAKANMAEFADCGIQSWSSVGGRVANPFDLTRSPYGSSGGTGAGIGAGFGVIGLGTDTEGSVIGPATAQGLFGLRPTVGRLPSDAVFPAAPLLDTVGPMGKHAKDVAYAFEEMLALPSLFTPLMYPGMIIPDITIGILTNFMAPVQVRDANNTLVINYNPDQTLINTIYGSFSSKLGNSPGVFGNKLARILNVTLTPTESQQLQSSIFANSAEKANSTCYKLQATDALNTYFAGSKYTSLANWLATKDLTTNTFTGVDFVTKYQNINNATGVTSTSCTQATTLRDSMRTLIESKLQTLGGNGILAFPALAGDPFVMSGTAFCPNITAANDPGGSIAPYAGLPSMTVPVGYSANGMPLGVNLITYANREDLLLRTAYAWEDTRPNINREPQGARYLPSNELNYNGCADQPAASQFLCRCILKTQRLVRVG